MKTFVYLIFIFLIGCSANKIVIENKKYNIYPPPGTVKISNNLFADEYEMTNISWKEYLAWIERVFGKESVEYRRSLPSNDIWLYQNHIDSLEVNYFSNPLFNEYPVVGISLDQAIQYTDWRTQRVAELILIYKRLIKPNNKPTPEDYFTIDRYKNGDFNWIVKKKTLILPNYKIPSIEEWEQISGYNSKFEFGYDRYDSHNLKVIYDSSFLYNTNEYIKFKLNNQNHQLYSLTTDTRSFGKNIYGLYGIIGNVSEMVNKYGISKGGSWKQTIEEIKVSEQSERNIPNSWTGFRNICKWEIVKMDGS